MSFKAGDRVRVRSRFGAPDCGREGTIIDHVSITRHPPPLLKVCFTNRQVLAYFEHELEIIEQPESVEQNITHILNDIGNALLRTQEAKAHAMKLDVLSTLNQVWRELNATHNTALKALRQEKAT